MSGGGAMTRALASAREWLASCCGNPDGEVACREPGDLCGACEAVTNLLAALQAEGTAAPVVVPSRSMARRLTAQGQPAVAQQDVGTAAQGRETERRSR